MKVNITINYQSRNSLDESLVESEIKETIESLMMSLRNQVVGISHKVEFVAHTVEVEQIKSTTTPQQTFEVEEPAKIVEEKPKKANSTKKAAPKKSVNKPE